MGARSARKKELEPLHSRRNNQDTGLELSEFTGDNRAQVGPERSSEKLRHSRRGRWGGRWSEGRETTSALWPRDTVSTWEGWAEAARWRLPRRCDSVQGQSSHTPGEPRPVAVAFHALKTGTVSTTDGISMWERMVKRPDTYGHKDAEKRHGLYLVHE